MPALQDGEVLLRVRACGVCRTDLHIVDEELAPKLPSVVPGHQIVGEVVDACGVREPQIGDRVGVSWLGGTDGTCRYCRSDRENLCDRPTFTGYDRDGGYAEYAAARADFTFALPSALAAEAAAPLLCAGIIGFRALRIAEVQQGESVGLYGFGASAHLALQVLRHWGCKVYVATRGSQHRRLAERLSAEWVGDALARPPRELDRAITFAPSGEVVVSALAALRKGGVVAINAIHLDRMPPFDYDSLLWGERQIRSVTNMTRRDARDFLDVAVQAAIQADRTTFTLQEASRVLDALREDRIEGAAVLVA